MDFEGINGGVGLKVQHRPDSAEVTNVHNAGAQEIGSVVGEGKSCWSKVMSILLTGGI